MNYTDSLDHVVHAGTGQPMHSDSIAVPTAVSSNDMNMVIWSLMEVLKLADMDGKPFNPDDEDSYTRLSQALLTRFARQQYSSRTRYYSTVGAQLGLQHTDVGATICFDGAGNQSAKLPPTGDLRVGDTLTFVRRGGSVGYVVTIMSNDGAATIDAQTGTLASAINLLAGETIVMTWSGAAWICSGTHPFRLSQFVAASGGSGYLKLPNGWILQYGLYNTTGTASAQTVTFPVAFPNNLVRPRFCRQLQRSSWVSFLESHGRQAAIVPVAALSVVEHLDVVEHV